MAKWTAAMRAGRYADAWTLAAETLADRDHATCDDPALPYHLRWVWDGRALEGRDVLVRCYHGLGDTIQYARFLPLLAQRAASVTVEVQPSLIGLLGRAIPGAVFIPFDPSNPLPPRDVDVEITELDFALRAAPEDVPAPYLRAEPAPLPGGTVALCYGSGDWDAERSIDPALLAPLCGLSSCITLMPEPAVLDVLNPEGCPLDIDRTAALVAGADMVITVDTMAAHLAGALGRPTWLLLKAEPDWRWPTTGHASAWYPSMRLYHQARAGDWAETIARVAHDLRHHCNERIMA